MKLDVQELSELAKELLDHPKSSLQQGLDNIGLEDVVAADLDQPTLEDLGYLAVQCACGLWKRPDELDSQLVCHRCTEGRAAKKT